MKILFAAEIFPMRNSFTQYSLVAREFLDNISSLVGAKQKKIIDARLICNNQTLEAISDDFLKVIPSVIHLSEGCSKEVSSALKDWATEGMELWREYVKGEGRLANELRSELAMIHNNIFEFEMIVCWGENSVFDDVAAALSIPCVHLELSSTRKPFPEGRFFDLYGANGGASSKLISIDNLKQCLSPPSLDFWPAYFNISNENNTEVVGFDDGSLTYYNNDFTLQIFEEGKNKTALVGLQLFDDANMQRHSKYNSPLSFLQSVLPKLVGQGWSVVVKTHPGAVHRPVNLIEQNKALAYASEFDGCYIYDHENTERDYLSLLRSVDLIVVINSSMGFEACLLGKLVVIEGDALYKIPEVFPSLEEVLNGSFDKLKYGENLRFLVYFFSKFLFLDRKVFMSPGIYFSIKKYWDFLSVIDERFNHESKFDVKNFINCFNFDSKSFIANPEESIFSQYSNFLEGYLSNPPRRGSKVQLLDGFVVFEVEKTKLSRSYDNVRYSLDVVQHQDNTLFVSGWAFYKKRRVPPVLIILIDNGLVVHVGRVSRKRKDVKDMFGLLHERYGFVYNVPNVVLEQQLRLIAIFSDNTAEELIDYSSLEPAPNLVIQNDDS